MFVMAFFLDLLRVSLLSGLAVCDRPFSLEPDEARWGGQPLAEKRISEGQAESPSSLLQHSGGHRDSASPIIHISLGGPDRPQNAQAYYGMHYVNGRSSNESDENSSSSLGDASSSAVPDESTGESSSELSSSSRFGRPDDSTGELSSEVSSNSRGSSEEDQTSGLSGLTDESAGTDRGYAFGPSIFARNAAPHFAYNSAPSWGLNATPSSMQMQMLFLQQLQAAMHSPSLYPDINVHTPNAEDMLLQELLSQHLYNSSQASSHPTSMNMSSLLTALGSSGAAATPNKDMMPKISITVEVKNEAPKKASSAPDVGSSTTDASSDVSSTNDGSSTYDWGLSSSTLARMNDSSAGDGSSTGTSTGDGSSTEQSGDLGIAGISAGTACSFIADCGSTGNRLQMYTASDMCPDEMYVPLNCGSGEYYPHLYVFAEPNGIRRHSVLLNMRQIVQVQAGIPLDPETESWIEKYPRLKEPGHLTDCVGHSVIRTMMSSRENCGTTRFELDATAGVRNYEFELQQSDKPDLVEKYREGIEAVGNRLEEMFEPYKSQGIEFGGFQVLKIKDEAELEAKSVKLWSSAVTTASGAKFADAISGIFSMGGKSSQFVRLKTEPSIKDGNFLLSYGHKQGLLDYDSGEGKSDEERRQQLEAGMKRAFDRGEFPHDEPTDFGQGLWIGITNTVLAAQSKYGLQLKTGEVYQYKDVRQRMDEALARINPSVYAQKKILIKLLIINYWLQTVFEEGSSFYFRHEWPTPKGGGCVYSEWPSAKAVLDDESLQEDLGAPDIEE